MAAAARASGAGIRAPWWFRLPRAMFFAAMCVVLSAAGHGLVAGTAPPLWSFGVAFGLVVAGVYAVTGRQCSRDAILAGLWLGQVGLHTLFACASPAGPVTSARGGMAMGGMPFVSPGMVAAHAFAGLVTAWCLHRGETAMWAALSTILRWIHAAAAVWLRPVSCAKPYRPRIGVVSAEPVAVAVLRHVLARRGPPCRSDRSRPSGAGLVAI